MVRTERFRSKAESETSFSRRKYAGVLVHFNLCSRYANGHITHAQQEEAPLGQTGVLSSYRPFASPKREQRCDIHMCVSVTFCAV